MITGANCDWNNVRKLADQSRNFTGLLQPGLGLEHIEQITGNTDEVEVWSLFDQPSKPVKVVVEISG
jgi:hypothetical protein